MAALQETEMVLGTTTNSMSEEQMLTSGRLKVVRVSLPCLVWLLRNGQNDRFIKIDGMPEDAMIVGLSQDVRFLNNEIVLRVWSASFDVVPETHTIDTLELWCSERKES